MSAFDKQVDGNHYKNMVIQPTEYCQRNGLHFCESAVVKYVSRHRDKGGRKDLEKAIHFLEMLLEMEYPENEVDHCVYKFYSGRCSLHKDQKGAKVISVGEDDVCQYPKGPCEMYVKGEE